MKEEDKEEEEKEDKEEEEKGRNYAQPLKFSFRKRER